MDNKKDVIGVSEYVDFPDLGLESIPSKVDTGAFTSSLHVEDLNRHRKDGKDMVSGVFVVDEGNKKKVTFEVVEDITIKNSNGASRRPVVKTRISFHGTEIDAYFNLWSRQGMAFPVLLGRRLLVKGGFLVDPARQEVDKRDLALKRNAKHASEEER